jgi:hypothetical protein
MNVVEAGQVTVLSFNDIEYISGDSVYKATGKKVKNPRKWLDAQIYKHGLVNKKDYIGLGDEVLFTPEAATIILERTVKVKVKKTECPKKSRHGYELDEYGLPVLPPQKRRGELINPYRI